MHRSPPLPWAVGAGSLATVMFSFLETPLPTFLVLTADCHRGCMRKQQVWIGCSFVSVSLPIPGCRTHQMAYTPWCLSLVSFGREISIEFDCVKGAGNTASITATITNLSPGLLYNFGHGGWEAVPLFLENTHLGSGWQVGRVWWQREGLCNANERRRRTQEAVIITVTK